MTVRVLKSPSGRFNEKIVKLDRIKGEDNLKWIHRALGRNLLGSEKDKSVLVLLGGNDPMSFRLRVAQSHARHDLSPSSWSHATFVVLPIPDLGKCPTIEVSLCPKRGFGEFGYPAPTNGIQNGVLGEYQSEELYPNIAILAVPVASKEIEATLATLKFQRSSLDIPQLILRWLAYCWGVGVPSSPLAEGFGIPSAALLEVAFSANGLDLTPGIESRSSCPEAIWQAARWWQEYYKTRRTGGREMKGAYTSDHELVPDARYGGDDKPRTGKRRGRAVEG